jgi:hypothetical protein
MGQTVVLFSLLYPSIKKSPVHPSRLFQRGNNGVDLAIHILALRELRLPLRVIIEEERWIFLTAMRDMQSNRVNGWRALRGAHQGSSIVNVKSSL